MWNEGDPDRTKYVDCGGVNSLDTKQEKIEKLEQFQKCLELTLIEVKQKQRRLTENK